MRRLIESTLVSLDGVIEAPERWARFDTEDTALSLEELGNFDAFVMGRGTYDRLYANFGHLSGNLSSLTLAEARRSGRSEWPRSPTGPEER